MFYKLASYLPCQQEQQGTRTRNTDLGCCHNQTVEQQHELEQRFMGGV